MNITFRLINPHNYEDQAFRQDFARRAAFIQGSPTKPPELLNGLNKVQIICGLTGRHIATMERR